MSMTESEAIKRLRIHFRMHDDGRPTPYLDEAVSMAITALSEIQQYRAIIGLTPEDLKSLEKDEIQTIGDALKAFAEWSQCKEIGTVEEFRELKEKATAKKPRFYAHNYHCTECGNLVGNNEFEWQRFEYCDKCGQKLDWSEGKE